MDKTTKWFLVIFGGTVASAMLLGLCVARSTSERLAAQERADPGSLQRALLAKTRAKPTSVLSPAEALPVERVYKIGEIVRVGYMSYLVTAAHSNDRLSHCRPNARFLRVVFTAQNDDREARDVPPFYLVDENGAEYVRDTCTIGVTGCFGISDELNPGVSKLGWVAFDCPTERRYKLKVSGGFWSSETALVDLSEPATR
jgi:hypothetical protein